MPEPIDYARDSVGVVRKKFRRRIVMFVIVTVVVMVIGGTWASSFQKPSFWIEDSEVILSGSDVSRFDPGTTISVISNEGWIRLLGPLDTTYSARPPPIMERFGSEVLGFYVADANAIGFPEWVIRVRYRTLFTLATIPWIITLIRLIRIWKRNRVFETEPRTQ